MKKILIVLVSVLLCLTLAACSNTIPVKKEDLKNAEKIGPLYDGLAYFKLQNGKCGYIDSTGQTVIAPKYDDAQSFDNGFAEVVKNGKHGIIDKTGKEVIACSWDNVYGPDDQGRWIIEKNGKEGLVDASGKELIAPSYDSLFTFSEGFARIKQGDNYGYINETGKAITEYKYGFESTSFRNGYAVVTTPGYSNTKYGLIDTNGKEVIPLKYQQLVFDAENQIAYAVTSYPSKAVKLDMKGNVLAESWYLDNSKKNGTIKAELNVLGSGMGQPSENMLPVMMFQKEENYQYTHTMCYLLTRDLALIVFPQDNMAWMSAESFENGMAIVRTCGVDKLGNLDYNNKGYFGVIDEYGKYVISPKYDNIEAIDGFFKVQTNNKYGLIDTNGRQIVYSIYDYIGYYHANRADVKQGSRYGYIDKTGTLTIPCIFESRTAFDESTQRAVVKSKGEWCIIDTFGNIKW